VGKPGEAGERIRCVVSVNMLNEGWDANNVTHILGLRAFQSQLLCEQVVGRGLRRMDYTPDPESKLLTAEYVDIFGVPFSLIPFKGREPKDGPPQEDRPKHEVMALPEREAFEIRFPVVEGYVVSLNRNLVRCDVTNVEQTVLDPWSTPTAAFVRPQVGYQIGHASAHAGFGFELVDRQTYYDSVHSQTIEFEIAREIVRALTEAAHPGKERLRRESRSVLFPQVLRIVQSYVRERVDFNGLHPSEVGLQTYAQRIIGLLIAAIVPDDDKGEAPLLPRLNRYKPIGSTKSVHFKTVKPVQVTGASHLNFVACDTNSWEQAATFQLDSLAKQAIVFCYARNDRLEFNIPYELYGNPQVYEPDFIVRLRNSVNVVLEIKGKSYEDTDAKHQAARRWVSAVNHWGGLGEWDFLVCREPQRLAEAFANLIAARKQRISDVAEELRVLAEGEVVRLRSLGWTQADFARALAEFLHPKESQ
jgi:type III restriction enzyme